MKDLIKKILTEEQDLEWAQDIAKGEIKPTPSVVVVGQTNNPKDALELHVYIEYGDADYTERSTIIFYRQYSRYSNFDGFERVVSILKDRSRSDSYVEGWRAQFGDEDFYEFCYDEGIIGYSETHDYSKKGRIDKVYYYDNMGNKYNARIV